jgi:hypothetical protein
MSVDDQLLFFFLVQWCGEFQLGVGGTTGCPEVVFSEDQLTEAKSYCDEKNECIGVLRHPNGKYTPRCGNMARMGWAHWLNKRGCLPGNQPP